MVAGVHASRPLCDRQDSVVRISLICLSVGAGHLGALCLLAVMSSASGNVCVPVSAGVPVSNSFEHLPRKQ